MTGWPWVSPLLPAPVGAGLAEATAAVRGSDGPLLVASGAAALLCSTMSASMCDIGRVSAADVERVRGFVEPGPSASIAEPAFVMSASAARFLFWPSVSVACFGRVGFQVQCVRERERECVCVCVCDTHTLIRPWLEESDTSGDTHARAMVLS